MKRDFKAYKKFQANTDAFIKKVEKFKLTSEDWDAVSFFQSGPDGSYTFVMIKFLSQEGKPVEYVMNQNGLGHMFHIIDDDGQGNIVMDDAALGDPMHIWFNNYIRGGRNGYLIKKCPQGTKMANEILIEARKSLAAFKAMIANSAAVKV